MGSAASPHVPIPHCPSCPAHPWAEGQSPNPHHSCPHQHCALGDTVPGSGSSLPFGFCQEREGGKEEKQLVRSRHSSYTFDSEHCFSLTQFFIPLMRQGRKKDGEGQKTDPPMGASTVLCSFSKKEKRK